MRRNVLTTLALAAGLLAPALTPTVAQAQTKPYGPGFDGWVFTATQEPNGVINCRATRKLGGREDIMAMRNNGTLPYFSVNAAGRKGKWPKTIIAVPGQQRGVMEWTTVAEANGVRMWFPMDVNTLNVIALAGAFEWALPDTEDTDKMSLGKRAGEAFERIAQCVKQNGR